MADVSQLPGELNIQASSRDDLVLDLVWSGIVFTGGYSFAAYVAHEDGTSTQFLVTGTGLGLVSGSMRLILTDTQISSIPSLINHHWYLVWTKDNLSRTALAGTFKLVQFV